MLFLYCFLSYLQKKERVVFIKPFRNGARFDIVDCRLRARADFRDHEHCDENERNGECRREHKPDNTVDAAESFLFFGNL